MFYATEVQRPAPQLLQRPVMTSAIRAWRNLFQVLKNLRPFYTGRFHLTERRLSDRLQVSGCFGAQLPVGQEIFHEFLDSDMPIVARPFALKPLPCFPTTIPARIFGLPDDPKHMQFPPWTGHQLDRTSPLDFEDEPFGFGLRREEPAELLWKLI
jgi:hypothetical protein